jgi:beta-galactosidase GanA
MNLPHLRQHGAARQLVVDDQPFLIIGGELHNSSSSSIEYMKPIWQRMLDLNFNTVLAPVSWELIEPEEGHFDFALVDGLIQDARRHDLRLVFLWFGSWKNGMSSYAPAWVKRDARRFPRVRRQNGDPVEVLSVFHPNNWQADATAFAALLRHLRDVDGNDHTVIMIQVENEVGVLGDSRDRSELAAKAFASPVPQDLLAYLHKNKSSLVPEISAHWTAQGAKTSGTWETVFGGGLHTDELFMAWHYARYVDHVAAAGKTAYPIPLYANAWLSPSDQIPGQYPSGGPLPHVMDVWLAAAPHLDLLAPDIYAPDFEDWCRRYTQRANPLFIPEMRSGDDGARHVFYAVGQHDAIGVSPFAVDGMQNPAQSSLANSYAILRQLAPTLLQHQGHSRIIGFLLDKDHPATTRDLGEYQLDISLDSIFGHGADVGYGLIIMTAPNEFLGAGAGFAVKFRPKSSSASLVGIAAIDEGTYRNGKWIPGRRLNGDENDQGNKWRFTPQRLTIERCTLYRTDASATD